ncbi:SOS response-associated peptidase family protein [Halalkalibacter nanhaiisediminis]|uniref:SOS response-associated peptidase family protein n=1 Tax=Halalkalibacter nanhaiisediminis TaxID=688079 RepID=UPI0011A096CD
MDQLHWGVVPSWASDKKIAYNLINARLETTHIKPFFKRAFESRRCIIPSLGFYKSLMEGNNRI